MHEILLSRYFREKLQQRIWGWRSLPGRPHRVLFSCTLTLLKSTDQVFHRTSLSWCLSDIFLLIRLRFWALGRKITEVNHSHHIISHQGFMPPHALSLVNLVNLDHLIEVVFVRLLHWKVTIWFSFYILHFGRKSLCTIFTAFLLP